MSKLEKVLIHSNCTGLGLPLRSYLVRDLSYVNGILYVLTNSGELHVGINIRPTIGNLFSRIFKFNVSKFTITEFEESVFLTTYSIVNHKSIYLISGEVTDRSYEYVNNFPLVNKHESLGSDLVFDEDYLSLNKMSTVKSMCTKPHSLTNSEKKVRKFRRYMISYINKILTIDIYGKPALTFEDVDGFCFNNDTSVVVCEIGNLIYTYNILTQVTGIYDK